MALLDTVKQALGIYYTERNKDAEIQNIIDFAKDYLLSAGVPSADLTEGSENPLAVQAIIIQAKMAVNTDPVEMRINPYLVSIIAQLRTTPQTESDTDDTDDGTDGTTADTTKDTEPTDPIVIDPVDGDGTDENQG